MPIYNDHEVVEAYRKGSPPRSDLPYNCFDESPSRDYSRRRRSSREPRLPRSRSPVNNNTLTPIAYRSRRHDIPSGRREIDHYPRHRSSSPCSSDSDTDSEPDTPRRRTSRREPSQPRLGPRIVPCSSLCADHPHRHNLLAKPPALKPSRSSSSSKNDEEEDEDQKAAHRKAKLVAAGLACVTSVAAANNIYQSTKAHEARKRQVREGEMCTSEARRLRNRGVLLDLFSLGVAAVSVNNVRVGWRRFDGVGKAA